MKPGGKRESYLTCEPMREGGVLAYLVSRRSTRLGNTHILIDGRADRDSARQGLANVLRRFILEVLIGEEMCFPVLRPFDTSSMMSEPPIRGSSTA